MTLQGGRVAALLIGSRPSHWLRDSRDAVVPFRMYYLERLWKAEQTAIGARSPHVRDMGPFGPLAHLTSKSPTLGRQAANVTATPASPPPPRRRLAE